MLERTPRGYPLPHPDRLLSEDVHNLREALTRIDADVAEREAALQQVKAQIDEDVASAISAEQQARQTADVAIEQKADAALALALAAM